MTKKSQLCEMLNIEFPVIMAPMFLVSNEEMIIEALKNGITGAIPALNYRTVEELRQAIQKIKKEVDGPFGINLIVNTNKFVISYIKITVNTVVVDVRTMCLTFFFVFFYMFF